MNILVGAFWVCLHRPMDDGRSRSRPNRLCWLFKLNGPVTEKTTISNLNIMLFSCIVYLCYKNLCTDVSQYIALLFYIILLSEQQCVTGNVIRNGTVYCLMNICSCFVMVLKLNILSVVTHWWWRWGVVMVWRMATLPMSHYMVREITTRSVPQSYHDYLRSLQ